MEDMESAKQHYQHKHDRNNLHNHQNCTHHRPRDDHSVKGIRYTLRLFSPQWFTFTMGTGITSLLLYQSPYSATWLYWLSVVVFTLHVILVILFTLLTLVRCILFPDLLGAMLRHHVESCYLGAFPVSLLSLANMIALICAPAWGLWAAYLAWALWIVASAVAVIVAVYVPWMHIHNHISHGQRGSEKRSDDCDEHSIRFDALKSITALHLLPPISAIVASSTAATVAQPLLAASPHRAASTLLTGYILLGLGLSSALSIMVLYLLRLLLFKLPNRETIASGFIAIGPLNMGAAGWVMLGTMAKSVALRASSGGLHIQHGPFTESAGQILHTAGLLIGLALWGFGLLWLWFAFGGLWSYAIEDFWSRSTTAIVRTNNEKPAPKWGVTYGFPFNLSWWSFIFPLGTMALSSGRLASELPSAFFRVVAAALTALVVLLFLLVGTLTVLDLAMNKGRKVLNSLAVDDLDKRKKRRWEDVEVEHAGNTRENEHEHDGEHVGENEDSEEQTLKGVDSLEDVEGRRRTRGERGSGGSGRVEGEGSAGSTSSTSTCRDKLDG